MKTHKERFQMMLLILVAVVAPATMPRAETIVVPNVNANVSGPGAGPSSPLNVSNTRWQQVYMAPELNTDGEVIEITKISFRIDEITSFSSFSTVVGGLSIFMSITDRNYNTASVAFADNYSGPLFEALPMTDLALSGSRSSTTSFDVIIPLPNAYTYDRRTGNLLIDIRVGTGGAVPFLDVQGFFPDSTYAIGGDLNGANGIKTTQGLVTEFTYSVVPEPETPLLLAVASCVLAFMKRFERARLGTRAIGDGRARLGTDARDWGRTRAIGDVVYRRQFCF